MNPSNNKAYYYIIMEDGFRISCSVEKVRITCKTFISDLPAVQCIKYDEDSNFLAAGCNGKIAIITSAKMHTINSNDSITTLCWKPKSSGSKTKNVIIAGESEGGICQWHTTSRKMLHRLETPSELYSIDYHKSLPMLVTGGKDCIVRIYDDITKSLVSEFEKAHTNRIFCVKYHPHDENIFFSGGWDSTIQIWDARVSSSVRSILGPHVCGDSIDIQGSNILAGSWREKNSLQLFSFESGSIIQDIPLQNHTWVYSSKFSSEGFICGGSNQNSINLLHGAEEVGCVSNFPQPVFSVDITKNGRTMVAGCGDGSISMFNIIKP